MRGGGNPSEQMFQKQLFVSCSTHFPGTQFDVTWSRRCKSVQGAEVKFAGAVLDREALSGGRLLRFSDWAPKLSNYF